MSQKIIAGLFAYARQEKAENMVIVPKSDRISFDYHFSSHQSKTISLPKRYEAVLLKKINTILGLEENDIISEKESKISFYNQDYHFKTSIIPGRKEKRIIISFNWRKSNSWRLNELGLKTEDKKVIIKLLQLKKGLLMVIGPKSSGKSALINAIGQELSKQNKSIYFLYNQERPEIDSISIAKLSSKNLEYTTKHNPDIIILDEIENQQNLAEVFKLADKGYLVIASYCASDFKEIGRHAKEALKYNKDSLKALKLGILSRLEKIDRQNKGKRDKRTMIGRYKLISFIK